MNLSSHLEYVRAAGHFFLSYFLQYFSVSKFAPNGKLQNDKKLKLYITCRKQKIPWGGGSPDTNAYLRAKLKVSVFENGQFSGHLIFDKKTFFSEKKIFLPR